MKTLREVIVRDFGTRWTLMMQQPGLAGGAIELPEVYESKEEAMEAANKIVQERFRHCEEWTIRVARHGP